MSETTEKQEAQIGLNDLAVMVQIIDMASEKGMFKGPDLKPVGELRDRLVTFIKANAPEGEAK